MKYKAYVTSHGGKVRKNNEDNAYLEGIYRFDDSEFSWSYVIEKKDSLLAAVFDGMGGCSNGEVASRIAASELCRRKDFALSENLTSYLRETNQRILDLSKGKKMGTTYAGVSVESDKYCFSNLGDSRGYLYRNGKLRQITKDHNLVQEMYECGILTKDQALSHPNRHVIYQYLGMEDEDGMEVILEPFVSKSIDIESKDICMLCSDGLTDMVSDKVIQAILGNPGTIEEKAEKLKECALENGGKDNVTVLLIEAC